MSYQNTSNRKLIMSCAPHLLIILSVFLTFTLAEQTDNLFLSANYMMMRTENKSMVLNFAYHINLNNRWTTENTTNVFFIDDLHKGVIMNRKYNKSMMVFVNQSAQDMYYLNNKSLYQVNDTILKEYEDIDLFAIEISKEIEHQFDILNTTLNNTIFLTSEEIQKLQQFIQDIGQNQEIFTQFKQLQYLNCDKISFYIPKLIFFCGIYFTCFALFCAKLFKQNSRNNINRQGYSPNIIQRFIPILPLLKFIYCILNYMYWLHCPWVQNNEGINFIRSFKVTLATLLQTMLCLLFVICALGFKISRERLGQQDIKKILILTSVQYFIDSIYSLGSYIDIIKLPVTIILNAFSIFMVLFVLHETKRNFDGLNYRLFIVNSQPQLHYIGQAIKRKKRYISMISLTIIFYFVVEITVHGWWDLTFQSKTIYEQLYIWIFHETVDFFVILSMGLIVNHISRNRLQAGESIIDISNDAFREDITRMKQVFMYQCEIDCNTSVDTQSYSNDKELNAIDNETPVIIVLPDENTEIKIAYKDNKQENNINQNKVVPQQQLSQLDDSAMYNSTIAQMTERNQLIANQIRSDEDLNDNDHGDNGNNIDINDDSGYDNNV